MTEWHAERGGWIRDIDAPPKPAILSRLREAGLDLRIVDSPGGYRLFLTGVPESHVRRAQAIVDELLATEAGIEEDARPSGLTLHSATPQTVIMTSPVTLILILVLTLIHVWLSLGFSEQTDWMIVDPRWWPDLELGQRLDALGELLRKGAYFNLLSPALIHFSAEHLALNLIALYALGAPLERALGSLRFIVACLALALFSNVAQALAGPFSFGGFSGVNYGLVGMVWVLKQGAQAACFARIPPAMIYFTLVFALAGAIGLTDALGLHMADTAHFSGLLAGVLLGQLFLKKMGLKAPNNCEVP